MKTWMLSLAVVAVPALAHADQCVWVEPQVAAKAQQVLADHPKVLSFCEPCGDQAPGIPEVARSVELGYQDVRINGVPVDLAYTYVQTSPSRYENLAALAGCVAHDVSPSLRVADETPGGGVLIVADDAPVAVPQAPAVAAPPSTPPHIYVFSTQSRPMFPWLTVALAGFSAFMLSLAALVGIAERRRRRRAMKPRASDLTRP